LEQLLPAYYEAFAWTSAPKVIVRGKPGGARRLAAAALMERDPSLLVDQVVRVVWKHLAVLRHVAAAIGALALVLASVGMFGVFSYWVRQRQHDIGVRLALGATSGHVVRMVLRASARAVGWGLVIGTAAALGAAQLLRRSLGDLSPLDPAAYGTAVLVLVASAALATLWPAWRAVKVDPLESLRAD
jgi:ABC-type antimicrobial peptide transport system permease subunit